MANDLGPPRRGESKRQSAYDDRPMHAQRFTATWQEPVKTPVMTPIQIDTWLSLGFCMTRGSQMFSLQVGRGSKPTRKATSAADRSQAIAKVVLIAALQFFSHGQR